MENQTTYSLNHLTTGYRRHGREKTLCREVTARLRRGELTCLLGVNGSGKSTLLRTMTGLLPPIQGSIELEGQALSSWSRHELARRVGVVLTDSVPVPTLRAEEVVAMGRIPYTGFWGNLSDEDRRLVDRAMRMVGMTRFRHRRLATLSDGERQKLMIAKALAQQTRTILLDEPIAFLDFPSKVEVLTLLRTLARKDRKAVLLSIHDLELALQMADRLWVLCGDGCLLEGLPRALAAEGALDFLFKSEGLSFDRRSLHYTLRQGSDDMPPFVSSYSENRN